MFRSYSFSSHSEADEAFVEPTYSSYGKVEKLPLVLIVDDDNDSLFLLGHILAQYACEVVVEIEGAAALEKIKMLQPDLILLDIWLPGMNGIEITQALRKDSSTNAIPIVAVTALASEQDRERILQAGCTQYISKPYDLEDMERILSGYLKAGSVEA